VFPSVGVSFETKRTGLTGKNPDGVAGTSPASTSRLKLTAVYGWAWVSDALKGYGEDRPELDSRNVIIAPES